MVLDAKDILRSGVIRDHSLSPHGEDLLDRFVEVGHQLDWAVGELGRFYFILRIGIFQSLRDVLEPQAVRAENEALILGLRDLDALQVSDCAFSDINDSKVDLWHTWEGTAHNLLNYRT